MSNGSVTIEDVIAALNSHVAELRIIINDPSLTVEQIKARLRTMVGGAEGLTVEDYLNMIDDEFAGHC